MAVLPKHINSQSLIAAIRGKPKVDLDIFLGEVMDVFGGARMLALEMHRTYKDPGATPHTRHKIMETIQRLIHASTVTSQASKVKVSDLCDEDLNDVLKDLLEEARTRDAIPGLGRAAQAEQGPTAGREESGGDGAEALRAAEDLL
jgi:hypothetical protein